MSEEAIDAGYHAAIAIQEWKARAQDAEACCVQLQHDKREAEARALKYEQALREIKELSSLWQWDFNMREINSMAGAALDKPEGK